MQSCVFCGTDRVKTYECKECGKEFCVHAENHIKIFVTTVLSPKKEKEVHH